MLLPLGTLVPSVGHGYMAAYVLDLGKDCDLLSGNDHLSLCVLQQSLRPCPWLCPKNSLRQPLRLLSAAAFVGQLCHFHIKLKVWKPEGDSSVSGLTPETGIPQVPGHTPKVQKELVGGGEGEF